MEAARTERLARNSRIRCDPRSSSFSDVAYEIRRNPGAFYMFPDVSEFLSPDGIRTSGERNSETSGNM